MSTTPYDSQEIQRGIDLLVPPGLVEMRTFKGKEKPITGSGVFEDREALVHEAIRLSGQVNGVYITMNPLDSVQVGTPTNHVQERVDRAISDVQILRRQRFLLDFDPVRAAKTPATESEHALALERAYQCKAWLTSMGWPEPVVIDSGNGAHLLFAIDLPNDTDSLGLLKRVLAAVAFYYSDALVDVDQTVGNAGRIVRLVGTLNCKGAATDERPHRLAHIIEVPDSLEPITSVLLEAVATSVPEPPQPEAGAKRKKATKLDVDEWVRAHGVPVVKEGPWPGRKGGYRWILNCPWNSSHDNESAYIVQFPDGGVAAGCHHNGCQEMDWRDMRATFEPDWQEQQAGADGEGRQSVKQKVAQRLLEIASDIELFHSPSGEPYAVIPISGRQQTVEITSGTTMNTLRFKYYQQYGTVPTDAQLDETVHILAAQAYYESPEHPVFTRVAGHDGQVYLDLADGAGSVVEVTPQGWQVTVTPPVRFRRPEGCMCHNKNVSILAG